VLGNVYDTAGSRQRPADSGGDSMTNMTAQEKLALVHSLLDLPQDMKVIDYVTVAHVHVSGQACEGIVRVSGNRTPEQSVPMVGAALEQLRAEEDGPAEGEVFSD
jgi:hypothetical protein